MLELNDNEARAIYRYLSVLIRFKGSAKKKAERMRAHYQQVLAALRKELEIDSRDMALQALYRSHEAMLAVVDEDVKDFELIESVLNKIENGKTFNEAEYTNEALQKIADKVLARNHAAIEF